MSVSVEIFVGVQAVSGFCLLVALSHLTDRGRPPYGRLGLCALGAAGMTLLQLCFGNPSAAGLGAVMMNLLVPFAALGNLPRMRRVRAAGAYLLLNLLLEGCLRVLYSAGLPALPAVLLASAMTLLLPGLGQRMRPLPVTRWKYAGGDGACASARWWIAATSSGTALPACPWWFAPSRRFLPCSHACIRACCRRASAT